MPKNIEDMIVPERKRTIRNIPIPEGRRKNNGYGAMFVPREHYSSEAKHDEFRLYEEEKKFSISSLWGRKVLWPATGVAFLVFVFAVLSLFKGATLSYVPKSVALSFENDSYTARKVGEGGLLYSVIKLSEDKGSEVSASGEKEVSRKASGTIIVYNKASTQPQKLRATTRFETPDGKVYRTEEAITIPGKKMIAGAEVPGTLEIAVYADRPGEEFNIGLNDFTLPGLKGTSLFSGIYARSKTEISGGFVGTEKVVSEADQARAKTELTGALRDELISRARAQAPEGFILLPDLSSVTFEDLPQTSSARKDGATVNLRGNLSGVMFKESNLSTHLAIKKITLAPDELIDIIGLESFVFSFTDVAPVNLLLSDEIKFSVTGDGTGVWRTDETALKTDLVGKHKRDIPAVLNNYPTITRATATLRPFWKNSFPADSADILVKKLQVN